MCKGPKDPGGPSRCRSHESQKIATEAIPRRSTLAKYYTATDGKHFGNGDGPGSTFTDPAMRRLNDVVALAARQRGMSLAGDDRDELIASGAPAESFRDGVRYLVVKTPGTVGVVQSDGMPDSTPIRVERHKPGASCSFVIDTDSKPTTDVATVIIGPHPTEPGREVVFTAHPGVPTPSGGEDRMGHREGQTVPLSEIRSVYGHDVWLNTRLKAAPAG